jgi:D-amino-acid dehydrogenase
VKILIVGCGLIGLTSAWFLRRRGHDVTVIDKAAGPGRETSYANGAMLTPSMAEPWNAPGIWRVLLASLGRSGSPVQLRLRAVPGMAGWGIRFLQNSTPARYERNTRSNLQLALFSLKVMDSLRQETGIEYDRAARGTLRMFRNAGAWRNACAAAARNTSLGLRFRALSAAETISCEPALAPIASQIAGGIHYPEDEVGNAYRFCEALANQASQAGVRFLFSKAVSSLRMRDGALAGVGCGSDLFEADRYVFAAGSYTPPLLRQIGVKVPVYPAKGYSVTFDVPQDRPLLSVPTFDVPQDRPLLSVPVVDDHLHAGVVPLEGAIRVVGTAEFTGYDRTLSPDRIQTLTGLLRSVLPQAVLDPSMGRPWCGLRPMSADGVPIIGRTAISNLMLNTGHGHLGWTMAAGSAELLAQILCGEPAALDESLYALSRFEG